MGDSIRELETFIIWTLNFTLCFILFWTLDTRQSPNIKWFENILTYKTKFNENPCGFSPVSSYVDMDHQSNFNKQNAPCKSTKIVLKFGINVSTLLKLVSYLF
jgi:hypothetical protein